MVQSLDEANVEDMERMMTLYVGYVVFVSKANRPFCPRMSFLGTKLALLILTVTQGEGTVMS